MTGNAVSVFLWGKEICKLQWVGGYKKGFGKIGAIVSFNKGYAESGLDLDPLGTFSTQYYFVKEGLSEWCRATEYEGIPRFISGSLPDEWGNSVFSAWAHSNKLKGSDITAVEKLGFIGSRGMGALEFVPSLYNVPAPDQIILEKLKEIADSILELREGAKLNINDNPGINDLMAVGMSAGGMHPKAIIAMDQSTGEIRSGQILLPERFTHYILKFNDTPSWPSSELEYTYFKMAREGRIEMENSSLINIQGKSHFLTERFDRKNGAKLHTATLQAINGHTGDYESIFAVCRKLSLPYADFEQLFRRAVFDYVCGVCDNHDKNFSFILHPDGKWKLAPAYDLTFSVNVNNPFIYDRHYMTIAGQERNVTRNQLMELGEVNDIRHPGLIIEEICDAAKSLKDSCPGVVEQYISSSLSRIAK